MSDIRLREKDRRRLEQQLACTHSTRVYRRTWALLQVADGHRVTHVAKWLHVTRRTVQRWLVAWREQPIPEALTDRPGRGRPSLLSAEDVAFLERSLQEPPHALGYQANGWTIPLIQQHLVRYGLPACSQDTLRRYLDALDIAWKRPRYVLRPDPQKEKKTPDPSSAQASSAPQYRAF